MSTVAKKVIMGSGAVDAYEIEQSIILDSASSSKLVKQNTSAGNRKTFTISVWVKRGKLGKYNAIFGAGEATGTSEGGIDGGLIIKPDDTWGLSIQGNVYNAYATQKLRDTDAWYHLVAMLDTTQAVEANRFKLYKNGVEVEAYTEENTGFPAQNVETAQINTDDAYHQISGLSGYDATDYFVDGCLAELNFIDGTALDPSSFGETNEDTGQWIPKKYSGSYGTNGFYLKFVSGAIGTDSSGEGNNYTATNLANSDVVIDTPTNNFATLNPLYTGSVSNTFSEGNLKIVTPSTGYGTSTATILPTSGKYYAEFKGTTGGGNGNYGVRDVSMAATNSTWLPAGSTKNMAYQGSNGNIYYNGSSVLSSAPATFTTNDVIAVAIDYDNSTVKWYKNNSLQYTATSADLENVTFAAGDSGNSTGLTAEANFGQKTLAYTPPSGYVALSTANLPAPAIPLPSAHFNTVIWTGNSTDNRVIPVGFAADLTWFKQRTGTNWHGLLDTVRGNSNPNVIHSNATNAAGDWTYIFKGHTSTGFTVGTDSAVNANSNTYVAWNWKANGSGSTNNDGNQASVVSANQTAGFSIATYTGTGSYATYGHGLGVIPEVTLTKSRSATGDWYFVTTAIDGSVDYLVLNTTAAAANGSATASTSSVFYSNYPNNQTVVAYNFASKEGFSKIGTYTGNGNADGPFVNTGFKPAWVMYKKASGSTSANLGRWTIEDNKRDPFNEVTHGLFANRSDAENTGEGYWDIDFLSNGFKLRTTEHETNDNGATFLYLAFAESPFKTANAR